MTLTIPLTKQVIYNDAENACHARLLEECRYEIREFKKQLENIRNMRKYTVQDNIMFVRAVWRSSEADWLAGYAWDWIKTSIRG